jgi:hypothetical protein
LILALAVAGAVALVAGASSGSDHAARTAAARAQLRSLHSEQERIRAAERRDPVLRRERARLRADQRAHFAHAAGTAGARWPIKTHAEQGAVVGSLERAITRDALARWHAGSLNARVYRTVCEHLVRPNRRHPPPPPLSAAEAGYECTAVTTVAPPSSRTEAAIIGFPFWARVSFRTGSLAWCKVNLLPSEHGIGDSLAFVPLPPVCDVLPKGGPA